MLMRARDVRANYCRPLGLLPPPPKPRPAGVWAVKNLPEEARSRLGEGWGGGSLLWHEVCPQTLTPTPNPSPQGGGEHTESSERQEATAATSAQWGQLR